MIAAKDLQGKNKGKSDPYCELSVFDDRGNKAAPPQLTRVIKEDLSPTWNQTLTLCVDSWGACRVHANARLWCAATWRRSPRKPSR